MRVHLVNFSDTKYRAARIDQCRDARRFGCDTVTSWSREDFLQTDVARLLPQLSQATRGSGYWLWKPWIIRECLMHIPEGDAVLYCDAGMQFLSSLGPREELAGRTGGFYLLKQRHRMAVWTKRDCFVGLGCDRPAFHDGWMSDASIQVYIRNERTCAFVTDYLMACCQPALVTDAPNILGFPNFSDFRDHRHDQSVLSLLSLRHQIPRAKIVSHYRQLDVEQDRWDHLTEEERSLSVDSILVHHHRKSGDYSHLPDQETWKHPQSITASMVPAP